MCLVHAGNPATIAAARREDEDAVRELEEVRRRARQDLTEEMRHRVELAELFTRGEPGRELREVLAMLGISLATFFGRFAGPEDYIAFFHDVPSVDVLITLSLARDRDLNRPIHRNDLKGHRLPLHRASIREYPRLRNFWAHVTNATGLARKYKTVVSNDTAALPQLLRDESCL